MPSTTATARVSSPSGAMSAISLSVEPDKRPAYGRRRAVRCGGQRGTRSSEKLTHKLSYAQDWHGPSRTATRARDRARSATRDLTILAKLSCALARARAMPLAA